MAEETLLLLHVYAQPCWHMEAFIVGNRRALEALRDAVDRALREGEACFETYAADGEAYDVVVLVNDDPWESPSWRKAALPYTDETARERRPDARWPGQG